MHAAELDSLELLLLTLLVGVAALALVAKRLRIAYPIVLVLGGLLLSLIPHVPRVSLNPELVFLVILPPLIFSAAFNTSWRDFRQNLAGICMLAFGLVGFTMFGVALVMRYLVPGFGWDLGLVLGALVAATDAIAATAIAKRLGLPRRITDLLEAESLVNDGSGLVALKFTLAMVVSGITPTFVQGAGTLLYLVFVGVAVGLLIGFVIQRIQVRINDAPIEITVSLIVPYIAYLAAERLQCSGILATLACGLYLGRHSSLSYSLHARIDASAVWRTLDFVLNGLVFLTLGLQLPYIVTDIGGISPRNVIIDGVVFSVAVLLLRFLWIYPGEKLVHWFQRWQKIPVPKTSKREVFLLGWAGMRGVLSLAAAFSLPEQLSDGTPFPYRDLIIFLTFCVIFSTLVIQGLSMPALIRRLGLSNGQGGHDEETFARKEMLEAGLQKLKQLRQQSSAGDDEVLDYFDAYYRERLAELEQYDDDKETDLEKVSKLIQRNHIGQELRNTERAVAVALRRQDKIHDEVLRHLEYELDLLDASHADRA
jgi:monovalent cation/hydrogen antiporter